MEGAEVTMKCPECGHDKSYCLDSRPTEEGHTRRRLTCRACHCRFTTLEMVASGARGTIEAELIGRRMLRAMEEAVANMHRLLTPREDDKR